MRSWLPTIDEAKRLAAGLLFIVFVSATWIETDVYRIVGLVLVLWGGLALFRSGEKVSIGWAGYACIGWGLYVAIRYLYLYQWGGLTTRGASEGIYLFPFFYMILGFLVFAYRDVLGKAAIAYIAVSLVMGLATIDLIGSFDGDFHEFFDTNNRIHSSVGAGFVILAAINVAAHAGRTIRDMRMRWLIEGLCYLTIVLCLIGLFGAKSKGVWAAMVIAVALQVALSFRAAIGRRAMLSGAVLLVAAAIFVAVFHAAIWKTLLPTLDGITTVLLRAASSNDPAMAIRESISGGGLPRGTYLRLMMWYNAVQVWSQAIVFGHGIAWKDLYLQAYYFYIGYDIVHNGYLEIGMRYGVAGIVFFVGLYIWTVVAARRALKDGLIAPEAYKFHVVALVFFAVTIVTNANNRLAIGESYMAAAAAFGFMCHYLRQRHGQGRSRAASPASIA